MYTKRGKYSNDGHCARCGSEAEFERGCDWCGAVLDLCLEHRDCTFLCERCFRAMRERGKDGAKRLARVRAKARARRARARLRGGPWNHDPAQTELWGP